MFMLKARSRVVGAPSVGWALTSSLFLVAVVFALLVSAGVAYAQGTPTVLTIESVAVTSDPGEDGGYAIGDEIQVGLTFSEAVAVTGAPQLILDVGGQNRTAEYSAGSGAGQLLFTYTVPSGDEDTDGIAVVADSLALNGGAIRAGDINATLTHSALQANDHKVDGIAPTVTVGGETRTYVPPDRLFNVVFYFSEKVYGITDAEITVTNGEPHDVRATTGNAMWPRYTRWDVIIVSAAEGPVTVTLEAGAATDAYGNENTAPDSALSTIAAAPVMVEVTRTTSGFAEGGKAEFIVTRSRDNGAIPVSLSLDQIGDFLSGSIEVYPPPDPNMPENPVTPTEVEFTETPFNLNVTFAAGETSKRIAVLTEDDNRDEDDGTVTLSVPAKTGQYKYIPGSAPSATAEVRDNDVPPSVSVLWVLPDHPFGLDSNLNTALEGGAIDLLVYAAAGSEPLPVTLVVTEVGSYLDIDGAGASGYDDLGNGRLRVTVPANQSIRNVSIPLADNAVQGADGSVTITVENDAGRRYTPSATRNTATIPVKDNDSPSTVSIAGTASITEGDELSYTLTRSWALGQSQGGLSVDVRLAQTGDYISWPTGRLPDADGLVTIPVTIAVGSLTASLTLDTVDDEVSEAPGSATATVLSGANSNHTTLLLDDDPQLVSVEAITAEITEGSNAQYRLTRVGDTSGATRVGLYVTGLPKIMTDATETIVLTSDNEDQSKRLIFNGAWVDYILEFAAGETEKTLPLTTEADSINEGDGWLGVRIVQRAANPFIIGTGYAQVLVKDDDIPTITISRVIAPTGATLSEDGTTWKATIVEGSPISFEFECSGNFEYQTANSGRLEYPLTILGAWVNEMNHPAQYASWKQTPGNNYINHYAQSVPSDCASTISRDFPNLRYVGPEGGEVRYGMVAWNTDEAPVVEAARVAYQAALAEAKRQGQSPPLTTSGLFAPLSLPGFDLLRFVASPSERRYLPQYRIGTVNAVHITVTNRDPTILIKAEAASVTEGQTARFIVQRLWNEHLLALTAPSSETVVYLRASQNGRYITGALPAEITFGQNEIRKVIEFPTVDDGAFSPNGAVTIELLPDTSVGSVNLQGKYSTAALWTGHTPEGGRSDRATVTIINNGEKPGITIAPASATEGDSGNTNMTFTLTLSQAVSQDVTVNYVTSDGTATAGQDYTAVASGTATIPANSTSATFTVSVSGDTTDEANETFNVTISLPEPEPDLLGGSGVSPPDVAIVGGGTATVSGTIMDDDPVVVTVAPKAASVVEGQDAVFVLTWTGHTDDALSMQVRLSAPGKMETLSVEFEAGATTTELSVETEDNDLVDYPSTRDYMVEVLGDGDINGGDDEIYTPGDPSQATVSVTDNDELQIITVHPHEALVREGGEVRYMFRRTGDASEELIFTYMRVARQAETTEFLNYNFVNERFPAGLSEITTGALVNGGIFPNDQVVNRLFPYKFTAQVYGDGHRYGVHRIWKAGTPNTATVVLYDDDATRQTVLRAEYPGLAQVGQTINIDFEVLNTGSEATGNSITVSSVQRASRDSDQTKPAEPRAGCSISGPLATGEIGTCRASFTLTDQDLTDSPMVLDATASDGTTTSSTLRIYTTVLGGIAVGFSETTRLSVTEPANGAANAQAILAVKRVGESNEQVQVAYTVEPIRTRNRPYPAEEGVDYEDNSATPGTLTFAANQTNKNITIDILGDEIDEPKELLRVTLIPPEGVLVEAANRTRAVEIVDGDPPSGESYLPMASLELVSDDPAPESAGSVDFAVVLDRVWGEDARFEVQLDTHDNLTATPAYSRLRQTGDFEAPDGLIHATIPAGQTRFAFSLTLYDDDVREENETFQMLLGSSITKYLSLIGDEDKVLVTIADNDFVEPTGIELALSSNNSVFDSVAENSSQHDITVTASFSDLRWPTDAADAALRPADPRDVDTTVRVEFDSANSAAAQIDIERFQVANSEGTFQDVESFDIVIPAGQTSGATTLRFKPVNDDLDEEGERVILQGTEVTTGSSEDALTVGSASFTITDNDTRGITKSKSTLALEESGLPLTYTLVLDSRPTDTVTINMSRSGDGLLMIVPDTLTFTTSDWNTPQTISVSAPDDGDVTTDRYATIIHAVSGGDYGGVRKPEVLTSIKNTTKAYIYLEDAQASESDGYIEFTVFVRPFSPIIPPVIRYATVDGTAVAGSDYTRQVNTGETYKTFTFQSSRAVIRVPLIDNQVYASTSKTFTLQLTHHNNKAAFEGDVASLSATGAILEDDPIPVVSIAGPDGELSYVSEKTTAPVYFTLTLTGRFSEDVTVDYTTGEAGLMGDLSARQSLAGATENVDYTRVSGTVTFESGETTKTVAVPVTNDEVSENTEFFGFKISNPQNAVLKGNKSELGADVGLRDDDERGVTIEPISFRLNEPASGQAAVAGQYTVKLDSQPTNTVTVTIGGSDPAVSLSGATLSNTKTLTFSASNWNTAQAVTVTPVKDANALSETITLTHIQSGGDYAGVAADSVTVNVTDSDTRNVVLSPTSLTVTEGDDTGVNYAVKLSTQPSHTVTVAIGGHSGTDLSISGATLSDSNTLTFSTSNWNTAQTVTVKAGHDGNADDESETLTHTASGGDYANLTKDLPVTVTDDAPATVTVRFGSAAHTVAESDDPDTTGVTENTVEVTVTLSVDPERTVIIPISKTNQGGATSADYSGVPQNVTFNAGDTSKTFTFTAAHDSIDDDGESVKLSFGTQPGGVSTGTPNEATVSITDDDVPSTVTVSFGAAAYTVAEGSSQTITVELDTDPERTVVIPIIATGEGGASDTDYSGVPANLTFNSSQTSQTFNIAVVEDALNESGEKLKLSFGSLPAEATAGAPAEATVSLLDRTQGQNLPTPPTVHFKSGAYVVAEGDNVAVKVTLSKAPGSRVSIPITHTDQGATFSADYFVPSSVTFEATETEKTITFITTQDSIDDDNESVLLGFGVLTGGITVTTGQADQATVSITDDDDPAVTVMFGQSAYTVAESDDTSTTGVEENKVEVTITLSADPERTVIIPISKTNQGGATSADYSGVPQSVTFVSGDTSKIFTFTAAQDSIDDDGESVRLSFGSSLPDGVSAGPPDEATVSITDDDERGVTIEPISFRLNEPASGQAAVAGQYTVKLDSQPTNTVTVTIGGSDPAVSLSGATLSNTKTLTFSASNWNTAQAVTVTPVKDANALSETITLTHIQSGGDYAGVAADSVTVNVTDSDTRNVVLSPTSLTVTEGDDTGVNYAVKLSTQPSHTVTVAIGGHSGTDLSISGATLSDSNTLTFSTSNWNTAQTVTVKAGHDGNADDESETLTHTASGGDYANLTKDLPVTVNDDAPATVTVRFGSAAHTVAESDDPDTTGVTENTVEVTVTLSADPERTVIIPISKTNQGGATSADYSGVPQNVTFNAGDTSKTFTFTAAQDSIDDDGESVKLSFGTQPGGVSTGTPNEATVSITDDDVPSTVTVSFGAAAYTVAEGSSQTITVELDTDPERTVVIPIIATGEGGASDTDYSGVPANLTFNSSQTSQTFNIAVVEDALNESGEKLKLSFGSLPAEATAGTPAEATVSLLDRTQGQNLPTPPTVHFKSGAYVVAEGDNVAVKVTLSKAPGSRVSIPITHTDQGATFSADYFVPSSVTFEATETEKTITFITTQDSIDDDNESVLLGFGVLTGGITVTTGQADQATVSITDDDDPAVTVMFGQSAYTVAESDDTSTTGVEENKVEVTVTLSADPERTVIIPISKTNQGGATSADYSGVPQNVTFVSGDTSKSFTFTAAQDSIDDDGESVKLSFGSSLPDGVSAAPTDHEPRSASPTTTSAA